MLDTTLVGSTDDAEVAALTPVGVPGVGDEPVGGRAGHAPSEDSDGVTAELAARGVHVDSRLVVVEVLVDGVGGLDGSVGHDLLLDSSDGLADSVGSLSEVLVISPALRVSGLALLLAGRSRVLGARARTIVGLSSVVSARGDRIGLAGVLVGVVGTSDDTLVDPVLPGLDGISTLASVTA